MYQTHPLPLSFLTPLCNPPAGPCHPPVTLIHLLSQQVHLCCLEIEPYNVHSSLSGFVQTHHKQLEIHLLVQVFSRFFLCIKQSLTIFTKHCFLICILSISFSLLSQIKQFQIAVHKILYEHMPHLLMSSCMGYIFELLRNYLFSKVIGPF